MKLDYDKRLQDTEKLKLKVLEEQFYFDSQIKVKTEMNEAKEKCFDDFQSWTIQDVKEKEGLYHKLYKTKSDLEEEVKSLTRELFGAKKDNWDYFTQLEKDRRREAVLNERNGLDTELDVGMILKKQERTQGLTADLDVKE